MADDIAQVPATGKPASAPNLWQRCPDAGQRNILAATLLMRIAYAMLKALIKRDGHTWIAKTGADWRAGTRLTPKKYKRTTLHLCDLGLVATEQHLVWDEQGLDTKNIAPIRVLGDV